MGKYISLGEVNRSLLFIVLMSVSYVINQYIYGFTYIECFYPMNIYKSLYNWIVDSQKTDFPRHRVFDTLFSYIGVIIISFFFLEKKQDFDSDNIENSALKLIYNKKKEYYRSKKGKFHLIFIIFLWIAEENLLLIYVDIFQDLDFWFFELIFVSLIFGKIFSLKILSHQKLGMAISIIVGSLLKIYNISLTLNSDTFYAKNKSLISFVIFYFFLITLRSYVNTQVKVFFDLKFISQRILLLYYGIVGFIITFLIGIFTSVVSCSEDLRNYVCKMEYNGSLYYDNFMNFYESGKNMIVRTIVILLGLFTFYFHKFYYILIIKKYTPIHVIFSFPIQFFIEKTFLLIFTAIFFRDDLFKKDNQLSKFLLDESGDIASIIGFLIYLEIIELNFCGFNFNLKKYISERSECDYSETIEEDMTDLQNIRLGSGDEISIID